MRANIFYAEWVWGDAFTLQNSTRTLKNFKNEICRDFSITLDRFF